MSAEGRVRSQEECLISATALDGALHMLDDDENAERLAVLADQWRAEVPLSNDGRLARESTKGP